MPSKIDNLEVEPGDKIVFITAGSGGWGDPLDREASLVARDVAYDLVSAAKAKSDYGVVLEGNGTLDSAATDALRAAMRKERGEPSQFSFGYFPQAAE